MADRKPLNPYDDPRHKKSLGELRQEGRARGDSGRRAYYFMLPQTQANFMRHEAAQELLGNGEFLVACENAGVKPTLRQAAKWLRHIGAAWAVHTKRKAAA